MPGPTQTATLPRSGKLQSIMENLLYWIGLAAVAVSALTGVLDAGRKNMDLIGAVMVGSATALGGGTVRDVLLDRKVFWISDQTYLIVALATALLIFFAVRALRLPSRRFLIPDAIGLALFTVSGTQIALEWQAPWLVASLLGVITGWSAASCATCCATRCHSFSCAASSTLLPPGAGALLLVGLQNIGVSPVIAAWSGMAAILAARLLAMDVPDHPADLYRAAIDARGKAEVFVIPAQMGIAN